MVFILLSFVESSFKVMSTSVTAVSLIEVSPVSRVPDRDAAVKLTLDSWKRPDGRRGVPSQRRPDYFL